MRRQITSKWLTSMRTKSIERMQEYTDGTLPAFGVRVMPRPAGRRTNTMTWFVRTGRGRHHKRVTLGRFPDLGLAGAREKAYRLLGDVPEGTAAGSCTVLEVAEAYLDHKRRQGKVTVEEDQRMLAKDVLPRWGHLQARTITKSMCRQLQREIADGRGAPRSADYLVMVLSGLFRYAQGRSDMLEGHPTNPASGIEKCHVNPRESRDLSWEEMATLWLACEENGAVACRAIQLGMLTGLRRNALLGGHWKELGKDVMDPSRLWWEIPRERMLKGGFALRVPLPPLAQMVLGKLPDHRFMFPSQVEGHRLQRLDKHQARLRRITGIRDLTFKQLRTTFATRLAELGVAPHLREALMGHTRGSVQERHYNKYDYRKEKIVAVTGFCEHFSHHIGVHPTSSFRLHRLLKATA